MTQTKLRYNIPSIHQIIKSINDNSPKMLKVHNDEFDRINKKFDKNENLSKPYTDYVKMLFITYICNKKEIKPNVTVKPVHIGMKMLNNLN